MLLSAITITTNTQAQWFKKKRRIVCVDEAAMNRIADQLIERGYHAEREVAIHPFPSTQAMIYAVIYWNE